MEFDVEIERNSKKIQVRILKDWKMLISMYTFIAKYESEI